MTQNYNQQTAKGSITRASNILHLAAPRGLSEGDNIIIETGGETGKGIRGTNGVGGGWLSLAFTTVLTMNSNLTKADGTYAWVKENGNAYRFDKSNLKWNAYTQWGYYTEKQLPYALLADVVFVSSDGLTITLSKKAKTSSKLSNVYTDHALYITNLIQNNSSTAIPAGKYAVSKAIVFSRAVTLSVTGAGKDITTLFAPNGCESISIQFAGGTNSPSISDLTVIGTGRKNGFAWLREDNTSVGYLKPPTTGYFDNPFLSSKGINMSAAGGRVTNVRCIDCLGYAIELDGRGVVAENCDVELTEGEQRYVGWQLHIQGQTDIPNKFINCTFKSPTVVHAMEGFRTQQPQFINCHCINGVASFNGASNGLSKNCVMEFTANSAAAWFSHGLSPIWEYNSFMGQTEAHTFDNLVMNQVGFDDAGHLLNGLYGRWNTPAVKVIGGSFTTPDMTDDNPCIGVYVQADGALIDGFIVNGKLSPYFHTNRSMNGASISMDASGLDAGIVPSGIVRNCVADIIRASDGVTLENNTCVSCP